MMRALTVLSALMLASCGTPRHVANTETKDSTRVEVRTERVERIDTVYVELPRQAERVVTRDTVSHLENDYAVSDASVDSSGFLHHSLETRRRSQPVPVRSTSERKDSVIYRDVAVTVEKPVELEKPLNAWQRFRLKSWWALASVIAGYALWKNRRRILLH